MSFEDGPHDCPDTRLARFPPRPRYGEAPRALPAPGLAGPAERLASDFGSGVKSVPLCLA